MFVLAYPERFQEFLQYLQQMPHYNMRVIICGYAMFVVGLAAAMSSVTLSVAATESVVIILKPFALIFATSGFRSGTEKPM